MLWKQGDIVIFEHSYYQFEDLEVLIQVLNSPHHKPLFLSLQFLEELLRFHPVFGYHLLVSGLNVVEKRLPLVLLVGFDIARQPEENSQLLDFLFETFDLIEKCFIFWFIVFFSFIEFFFQSLHLLLIVQDLLQELHVDVL